MSRLKTKEELLQARAQFEAALAVQPESSHALAGLGSTHVREVVHRWADDRKASLATADRWARRALEVDSLHREALIVLASALVFDGRIDESMTVTRKLLELNPNDAVANQQLAALYYFAGRWEDAIEQVKLGMRLNPLDRLELAASHRLMATALIPLRRYGEAIEQAQLILDGPFAGGRNMIASAEALRGNLDKARELAAESLRLDPTFTVARSRAQRGSKVPAYVEGMDHYYEGLRLAGYPEGKVEGK
jgi:tetratricopeptide (TPR) repeat protein